MDKGERIGAASVHEEGETKSSAGVGVLLVEKVVEKI